MQKEENPKKYDLEERTSLFGEKVIKFAKKIPRNPITMPLITQFVKSGASIGANYCEADDAETSKDFVHKIGICKKEARETKYWLRMIAATVENLSAEARELWKEANELNLIFNAISKKIKNKKKI